mmetsp:Transcript_16759/g.33434  ORF Transcript_16759/g.33434 Transcript_16759/m.33434 type:complete len:383 (+) Transcript_16759:95-1243(+)
MSTAVDTILGGTATPISNTTVNATTVGGLDPDTDSSEEEEEDNSNNNNTNNTDNNKDVDVLDENEVHAQLLSPFSHLSLPADAFSTWSESRNLTLLHSMLDLDDPQITDKMLPFLQQPSVLLALTSFLTLPGQPRCTPSTSPAVLRLSFKALECLTPPTAGSSPSMPLTALFTDGQHTLLPSLLASLGPGHGSNVHHVGTFLRRWLPHRPLEVTRAALKEWQTLLSWLHIPSISLLAKDVVCCSSPGPQAFKLRSLVSSSRALPLLLRSVSEDSGLMAASDAVAKARTDAAALSTLSQVPDPTWIQAACNGEEGKARLLLDVLTYASQASVPAADQGGAVGEGVEVDNFLNRYEGEIKEVVRSRATQLWDAVVRGGGGGQEG